VLMSEYVLLRRWVLACVVWVAGCMGVDLEAPVVIQVTCTNIRFALPCIQGA
jgi:hypothetical protein